MEEAATSDEEDMEGIGDAAPSHESAPAVCVALSLVEGNDAAALRAVAREEHNTVGLEEYILVQYTASYRAQRHYS